MYSLLLFVLAGIVIGAILGKWCDVLAPVTAIGGLLGLMLGFCVAIAFTGGTPQVWVVDEVWTLSGMHGSDHSTTFVWRYGTTGSGARYHVMLVNPDGSFSPFSAPADELTKVFEDENLTDSGKLIVRRSVADPQWRWRNWVLTEDRDWRSYEYHVPKGTLKNSFSVN